MQLSFCARYDIIRRMDKHRSYSTALRLLAAILCLLACLTATIGAQSVAAEESNSDLRIEIDGDTRMSAYGESFAYTLGTTLCVADANRLTTLRAAVQSAPTHVAMTGGRLVVRTQDGALTFFAYDAQGVRRIDSPFADTALGNKNVHSVATLQDGTVRCMTDDGVLLLDFAEHTVTQTFSNKNSLFRFSAWSIDVSTAKYVLYGVLDGRLYRIDDMTMITEPTLERYAVAGISGVRSVAAGNGRVYLSTADGLQAYDHEHAALTPVLPDIVPDPDAPLHVAGNYLYALCRSDLSIKQYVLYDGVRYVNSFDNNLYRDPQQYDDVRLLRTTATASAYISPKNLHIAFSVTEQTYLLHLHNVQFGNRTFGYVTDGKGNYGYIAADGSAPVTTVQASDSTPFGAYAMPLHPDTPIYEYPLAQSKQIARLPVEQMLTVLDNVGGESLSEWGWYHVAYTEAGAYRTGYVRGSDLAPYTDLHAPSVRKDATISASKFGAIVKAYRLPSTDSEVVREYVDGERVTLAEQYDPRSEWTRIVLGDTYAYVPTSALHFKGLTGVQIAVIVIVCALALATVCVGVTLAVRKRRDARYS